MTVVTVVRCVPLDPAQREARVASIEAACAGTLAGFKQPRQAIVFTRDAKTAYVLNEDLSISKVERAGQRIVATVAAAQAVAAY